MCSIVTAGQIADLKWQIQFIKINRSLYQWGQEKFLTEIDFYKLLHLIKNCCLERPGVKENSKINNLFRTTLVDYEEKKMAIGYLVLSSVKKVDLWDFDQFRWVDNLSWTRSYSQSVLLILRSPFLTRSFDTNNVSKLTWLTSSLFWGRKVTTSP